MCGYVVVLSRGLFLLGGRGWWVWCVGGVDIFRVSSRGIDGDWEFGWDGCF